MSFYSASKTLLTTTLLVFTLTTDLNGLAKQTWISGVGDDVNPCSRSAPCKTTAGAISKTDPAGQIVAMDPGGFGQVTINKSITIDGTAMPFEVIAAADDGITIAAGATDVVILRHISLNGVGQGVNGITFTSGKQLILEDCSIIGFTGTGIDINLATAGEVVIRNTSINNCVNGISVVGLAPIKVDLVNSFITQNSGIGVIAKASSVVSCTGTLFASNGTALQSLTGGEVRISNNDFYDNGTGIDNGGGVVATANNNREAGSGTPGSPTTSIVFQ